MTGVPHVQRRYPHATVATPHYLATAAGLEALAAGGNALDAALAANLALGVVAPYFCGYGGDIFAIVWDGELHGYLGSGRAPARASLDAARARHGEHLPPFGADVVTVPGAVAGWFDLLDRFGTRTFGDLAARAHTLAVEGFEVTRRGAVPFRESHHMYAEFDDWMAVYRDVSEGSILRQPAMARTIAALAESGPDAYYRGEIGAAIAGAVTKAGGALAPDDLANHVGRWVDPLRASFAGAEVAELPPPTQGVTALEALRILDGVPLPPDGPERTHLLIEATKQAMADRGAFVGDPDHMPHGPEALLGDAWVQTRRAAIDPDRASVPRPVQPQPGGTAYLCAADADGMLVSLIQSNFVHFGSGVHVPEWGINLNNRGFSFSLEEGAVNSLRPGAFPMHTLIPAMVLRDGAAVAAFGSMGGDAQVPVHVQVLASVLGSGADFTDAIAAPRWRLDVDSWRVAIESRADEVLIDGLRARGHDIVEARAFDSGMGHAHATWRSGTGYGVTSDPRSEGGALGL